MAYIPPFRFDHAASPIRAKLVDGRPRYKLVAYHPYSGKHPWRPTPGATFYTLLSARSTRPGYYIVRLELEGSGKDAR